MRPKTIEEKLRKEEEWKLLIRESRDLEELMGKKRKETLVVALVDNKLDDGKIRMNKTVRKNLRVRLGDVVQIKPAGDVPNLTKIHVLPLADTIEGLQGDLTKTYLIPYFK
ncbi:MAG: hypothetical protein ACK559_39835, partial [bacterium]